LKEQKYDPVVYEPQTIKNIRGQWLYCLLILSDIDHQTERWLDVRIRNPHYTFDEFIECYYDVIWRGDYKEMIECGYFSQEEYEIVKEFHEAIDTYQPPKGRYYDHKAILNDLKWQEIVALGRKSLDKLKTIIKDQDELDIFDNYIPALVEGDFTWGMKNKTESTTQKESLWSHVLTRLRFKA